MQTSLGPALEENQLNSRPAEAVRVISDLRSRVIAATGALLVGQGVTVAVQLLSLPLFLHFWDASRYGRWVMISAVPVYFAMSDGGIVPVAANEITMLRAGGQLARARSVFQSALALVLSVTLAVGVLSALVLLALPDTLLDSDARCALWLLIVATAVGLFGGVSDGAFRAYDRYATGVMLGNGARLIEFVGLGAGLALGGSFTAAAAGLLVGRCSGTLILGIYCARHFPDLPWSLKEARKAELHALIRPAAGFMAFPLGNALSIQAVTLVVGALFGTAVVAVFNTYRTVSRVVLQATSTFGHAMWTDFSRLYGARDTPRLRHVFRKAIGVGALISVVCSLAMIPMAPLLLSWWTHGKIAFDAPLFLLFALATFVGGLSNVPRGLLMSTNTHARLGLFYVVLAGAGVLGSCIAGRAFGPGGVVLATAAVDAAMLALSLRIAHGILDRLPSTGAGSSTS